MFIEKKMYVFLYKAVEATVKVLYSVHLCAVLDMRVLASLVREQTVRD
jgi:hypothetical protein